jgi:hypothetical protein
MAFQVVDGDQGQACGESQSLGIGNADEQRASEARAGGDSDGVKVGEGDFGLGQSGTDDGDNCAQVFA